MDNEIILHFRDTWSRYGTTFARGRAHVSGQFLEGEGLAEYFDANSIEEVIDRANGFWGLVKKFDNSMLLAADRMRSYPLFYGIYCNTVYVSDDPYWLKEALGCQEYDQVSWNEFLVAGYVTGRDTLFTEVKQILPGEIVYIDYNEDDQVKIKNIQYYSFIHGNYFSGLSREQLLQLHGEVFLNSVKRLIDFAGGRTVVVPLSGGYDSRLLVTALRKMEYENVITFSYGKNDNEECLKSREVAESLNFKWIFIPYDNDKTFIWYNSELRKDFNSYGDNLSTVLPDREWPAVLELKRLTLIPEDSLFVPGHSGDFISGGHIPLDLCTSEQLQENLVDAVLKKHYVMWNWKGLENRWRGEFSKKILENADIGFSFPDTPNMYEKWNWQECQIKRMVNSVKIYDFFKYEYWLPLWDYEYMDFWSRVPLYYRINKNLYDEYVVALYAEISGLTLEKAWERVPAADNDTLVRKLYKKTRNLIAFILNQDKTRLSKEESRNEDWEQSSGRMTKELYDELMPYMIGRSSCTTLERLGLIYFEEKKVPEGTIKLLEMLKKGSRP